MFPFHVTISQEKQLASGRFLSLHHNKLKIVRAIYSSRATDGLLDLHNRHIFLGYITRWVTRTGKKCWRVHTWSGGRAHWTVTRNFDDLDKAEGFLCRRGVELQYVSDLDVRTEKDGWFRIISTQTNRPKKISDHPWRGYYPTHREALRAINAIARKRARQ